MSPCGVPTCIRCQPPPAPTSLNCTVRDAIWTTIGLLLGSFFGYAGFWNFSRVLNYLKETLSCQPCGPKKAGASGRGSKKARVSSEPLIEFHVKNIDGHLVRKTADSETDSEIERGRKTHFRSKRPEKQEKDQQQHQESGSPLGPGPKPQIGNYGGFKQSISPHDPSHSPPHPDLSVDEPPNPGDTSAPAQDPASPTQPQEKASSPTADKTTPPVVPAPAKSREEEETRASSPELNDDRSTKFEYFEPTLRAPQATPKGTESRGRGSLEEGPSPPIEVFDAAAGGKRRDSIIKQADDNESKPPSRRETVKFAEGPELRIPSVDRNGKRSYTSNGTLLDASDQFAVEKHPSNFQDLSIPQTRRSTLKMDCRQKRETPRSNQACDLDPCVLNYALLHPEPPYYRAEKDCSRCDKEDTITCDIHDQGSIWAEPTFGFRGCQPPLVHKNNRSRSPETERFIRLITSLLFTAFLFYLLYWLYPNFFAWLKQILTCLFNRFVRFVSYIWDTLMGDDPEQEPVTTESIQQTLGRCSRAH